MLWRDPLFWVPIQTIHALGLLVIFGWVLLSVPRGERWLVGPVCLISAAMAALGGRAMWLATQMLSGIEVPNWAWLHPTAGGYASLGFVGGGAVVLASLGILWRKNPLRIASWLDALVPAGAVGLGVARLGCMIRGCDVGVEAPHGLVVVEYTRVVPAVTNLGVHHPFALYLGGATVLWTLCVCMLVPKGRAKRALWVGAGYFVLRAALESLRHPSQVPTLAGWSVHTLLAMVGLAIVGVIGYGAQHLIAPSVREVERAQINHDDGG